MWEINLTNQITTFLMGIVLGVGIGVLYSVMRSYSLANSFKQAAQFVADIIFWIVSAITVFIFLLSRTNGQIRGYVIISVGIGFFVFRVTVYKFFSWIFLKIFVFFKSAMTSLGDFLRRLTDEIFKFMTQICKIAAKSVKKSLKVLKKLLKSKCRLLYTKLYKYADKGGVKSNEA